MEIEPSHDETSDGRSFCPSDFPTHEIDRSRIQFNDDGKDCPKGGFALVRKAWLLPPVSTPSSGSRELVAVKILRVDDRISPERLWKRLTREVFALSSINHPNVLRLLGSHFDPDTKTAWIVSPWAAHGDVYSFLEEEKQKKPEEPDLMKRLNLLVDATEGLAHLHSREPVICHADIKAANVLVTEVDQGAKPRGVLGDFGLACLINDRRFQALNSSSGLKASVRWSSPERLFDNKICAPGDIWSWAWLVWELITGALPFRDIPNEARVILAIDDPERLPDITQHASFTHLHALQEIMQLCWLPDPELRAKVEDCLAAARSERDARSIPPNHQAILGSAEISPTLGTQRVLDTEDPFDLTNVLAETSAATQRGTFAGISPAHGEPVAGEHGRLPFVRSGTASRLRAGSPMPKLVAPRLLSRQRVAGPVLSEEMVVS